MARPLRIQYENAYCHVTCRGNARQEIFGTDQDRSAFLDFLNRSREIYQVEILAYVLMGNHFHLVVKTPLGNLKEFMRHFNISCTSYFNRRHGRAGHLYQGRYKAFLIDADSYLQEVTRYVHLNPIRVKRKGERGVGRGLLMEMLYRYGGMNQRQIGEMMGVDYSSVSVTRKRFHLLGQRDKRVLGLMERVQNKISQG